MHAPTWFFYLGGFAFLACIGIALYGIHKGWDK